jgi:hypothetical protein
MQGVIITPIRVYHKHGMPIPNYPVITRGNQHADNILLQQLWGGIILLSDILAPGT